MALKRVTYINSEEWFQVPVKTTKVGQLSEVLISEFGQRDQQHMCSAICCVPWFPPTNFFPQSDLKQRAVLMRSTFLMSLVLLLPCHVNSSTTGGSKTTWIITVCSSGFWALRCQQVLHMNHRVVWANLQENISIWKKTDTVITLDDNQIQIK